MSKHTPGPWAISSYRDERYSIVMDNEGFDVAKVDYPNQEPNARLIVAAPDLLQALKVISVWAANGTGWKDLEDIRRLADESVSKATGGSDD